ncbi:MAG: CrcB family protein [Nocardioidaceae bacterium]|nr:CrcB family protein [Nocardioidaceae bacterium]
MRRHHLGVELAVIAVGGMLGALVRLGIDVAFPVGWDRWPWPTLAINVVGSGLMAALLLGRWEPVRHPLAILGIGTGALGGFTTFSTYAVQADRLLATGHLELAVTYLGVTVGGAVGAVHLVRRLTPLDPGKGLASRRTS